jgi:hypothetical protein
LLLAKDAAWQLLADNVDVADAGTIQVLTTPEAFSQRWSAVYGDAPVPRTTVERPLYVFFNLLVNAGCPDAWLDGVVLDSTARLLYGLYSRPQVRRNCGDIAGAHTFVVAIDRDSLPRGRLMVRIERDFSVCADCGRELEQVEVDL